MFFRRRSHAISEEQLSAYIDGQLDDAAAARLEEHVEACSPCRDALAELRTVRSTLRELPQVAAPRSFALREADVRPAPATRVSGGRTPALLGGLASVALVAFLTLVSVDVLNQGSSGGRAGDSLSAPSVSDDKAVTEGEFNAFDTTDGFGEVGRSGAQPPESGGEEDATDDGELAEGAAPEATTRADVGEDDDSETLLRAGEAAAAAVALVAAGGFAFAWRRRRVKT